MVSYMQKHRRWLTVLGLVHFQAATEALACKRQNARLQLNGRVVIRSNSTELPIQDAWRWRSCSWERVTTVSQSGLVTWLTY